MKLTTLTLSAAALAVTSLFAQEIDRARMLERLFRRADADSDGRISSEEFPGRRGRFRRLDVNGDGYLDEADLEPEPTEPAPTAPEEEPETAAQGEVDAQAEAFFEERIRPVLEEACYRCHSAEGERVRGGLRLDSREALLAGGASGPAIVPGHPEASLMIEAIRYEDEDFAMPPKQRLADQEVADLERWVALGAPWPGARSEEHEPAAGAVIDLEAGRAWWAFQPLARPDVPGVDDEAWVWSTLDRFVLSELEARELEPVGDAEDLAWLRRVHLDLIGVQPSPEQVAVFAADRSTERFEHVVDNLLASPLYGERWGRHWLDVARYAESSGRDANVLYPHAWRYRDYVIDAFQRDLPFDRFLVEQLAGDLLPAEDPAERARLDVATGYLALGAKSHTTRERRQFEADVVDEQIDSVTQGMLGLTVACARCHDHKFDPLAARDYYAMAGIFSSTETLFGTLRGPGNLNTSELRTLPEESGAERGALMEPGLRRLVEAQRDRIVREIEETRASQASEERDRRLRQLLRRSALAGLEDLLGRFDEEGRPTSANLLAMGARDERRARDARLLVRGEIDQPGTVVPRGVPKVLPGSEDFEIAAGSGRLELARWIASAENPLTARVWANRVWMHLFGEGLVRTPNNFGAAGQAPSHPELLDELAVTLIESGWSTQALVREVVLSHTYHLAARGSRRAEEVDPEVVWLWRYPERRLDAEVLRDSMLFAAGTLELARPLGSIVGTLEGAPRRERIFEYVARPTTVRSVYLPVLRDRVPEALEVFDAADPSFVSGGREVTTVATQALYLMNDEEVLAAADALGARLEAAASSERERIDLAFEWILAREPSAAERRAVKAFLRSYESPPRAAEPRRPRRGGRRARERALLETELAPETPWAALAQSLFLSVEFRYSS